MDGRLVIYGTGGFARQILPLVREYRHTNEIGLGAAEICFAEDNPSTDTVYGYKLLSPNRIQPGDRLVVAISDGKARERLVEQVARAEPVELRSPNARIATDSVIGPGAILCDFCVVEPFARIGSHFQANVFAFVAHDCEIGDYVHLGPRATINGNVHIGSGSYIGAGALIRHGTREKPLRIGEGATVGMGAVVTKDVPAGATVIGNPARSMRRA